jgi:excisionase family DNA binding protein
MNGGSTVKADYYHQEPLAYSIADACRVTSIGRTRLYALIAEGRLEVRKIGRRTLIPAASLRALIEALA